MAQKASILVVEDNEDMRLAVSDYLQDIGYVVHSTDSAEKAIERSLGDKADLAILDIALPGMSGLELTRNLKQHGFSGPIIGLTARDTVEDRIIGLGTGMDDYLVKPFDLRELSARVNAQLRTRGTQHDLAPVVTTNFKIEPRRHKFYKQGNELKLTLVEFRIMLQLMQHALATVSSSDLIEAAWGEDAATTNPPIRIHISNLRNKMGDTNLTMIQTIPGVGYMLND